jgi:regulator of sigma E protease
MPGLGSFAYTAVAFVIALGILIAVHEYGHYIVARWCGVKVLRFSLGFGKPVLLRRLGPDQTEWVVTALPLGGFVRMLDEREAPVAPEELHRAFNRQSVGKRFLIVLAGPVANFLLAVALYWGLFVVGTPGMRPLIEEPARGTAAAAAGFAAGDAVVAVDDVAVASWTDLRWILLKHAVAHRAVRIDVSTESGRSMPRSLDLSSLGSADYDADFLGKLGLAPYNPRIPAVIGNVLPDSPAARDGLRTGDLVRRAGGRDIALWRDFVTVVQSHPNKPLTIEVERGGKPLAIQVTPSAKQEQGASVGKIGAAPKVDESLTQRLYTEVRYGPIDAIGRAVEKTWDTSVFSLEMLGRMVIGEISWHNVSGPLTIADYAGQTARHGAIPYLTFLALVSISLGVLNLLPVPLLDGGHLLYYIVEIFKGSPVPDRIMELGQRVGMALLLVLMLAAFYNDINRLLSG